jgi:hypothetical protein
MTDKPRTATPFDFLEDADDELKAIAKRHAHETAMDELDRELGLTTPQAGRGLMLAAEAHLLSRGIVPADATQEQMIAALERVAPS